MALWQSRACNLHGTLGCIRVWNKTVCIQQAVVLCLIEVSSRSIEQFNLQPCAEVRATKDFSTTHKMVNFSRRVAVPDR
jgi:hypothetical protein